MRSSISSILGLTAVLLAGCGEDATYMIVTVDKRPAVHDARSLKVTLSNAGSMRTDDLEIAGQEFPMTFSLSAPGRSGDLVISIDALDVEGQLVGRGAGSTSLDQEMTSVTLDSADFVVNSEYANDQFLTTDFEAVGFQLAGISNGQWSTVFRDECTACSIYARRFDSTGLPVFSQLAAGDIAFSISEDQTTAGAMPAIASAGLNTLAFWDYTETAGGARGIACRAMNEMGAATSGQVSIAAEATDVVSAAALPNGNFVATWQIFRSPSYVVRRAIVTPQCTLLGNLLDASTTSGSFGALRSNAAGNGNHVLYGWVVDGSLRLRISDLAGNFAGNEITYLMPAGSQEVEHVRISPWGTGFAVAVRWASSMTDGPGKIEVHRVNITNNMVTPAAGNPILISDQTRSDFASNKGFSLAQRPDGALLVVYHVCETGPGLCDVFGRILRPTGAPVGEPFVIPTSTASEQINPSVIALQDSFVAAWNDSSGEAPDRSGTAVRARVVYPVYDDARSVHGATCGASAPGAPDCGEGLACAMGSDGVQRCYATCTPPFCPGGGTCTTVDESTSACTF